MQVLRIQVEPLHHLFILTLLPFPELRLRITTCACMRWTVAKALVAPQQIRMLSSSCVLTIAPERVNVARGEARLNPSRPLLRTETLRLLRGWTHISNTDYESV